MARTIVITGCSTGFGREAAERLARGGDRVYATMRGVDGRNRAVAGELRSLVQSEGIDLRVLELDVTSDASVAAAAEAVLAESGAPDVLVNNAGQMFVGLAETFTTDEVARQLDVNFLGIHRMLRAFLPAMRAAGHGLVINLSSIAGRLAAPFNAVYHASKWGLEGYSLALRGEVASSGIDVVVVEPGPFTTQLFPRAPRPEDAEGRAATYPDSIATAVAKIQAAFDDLFADPEAPTDPTLVVDAIVDLIDRAPGTRPFRTVVGVDMGVRARNELIEPLDAGLLEGLGLSEWATIDA